MKVYIVFEIGNFVGEDGQDEEVRMIHKVFKKELKANKYAEKLSTLPANEDIPFEVEEHEVE